MTSENKLSKNGFSAAAWAWMALALLIRLAVMPLTMHSDLLFIQVFPSFLSYHGNMDIYGSYGAHFLSRGFIYYPPLVYYAIGSFQWLLHWVNPGFGDFMDERRLSQESQEHLYG